MKKIYVLLLDAADITMIEEEYESYFKRLQLHSMVMRNKS